MKNNHKNYTKKAPNTYSDRYNLTADEIRDDVGSGSDLPAVIILALCEVAYDQGKRGVFFDGVDFENYDNDPEWKAGPGKVIANVSKLCKEKEGALEFYNEAYFLGLVDGGHIEQED